MNSPMKTYVDGDVKHKFKQTKKGDENHMYSKSLLVASVNVMYTIKKIAMEKNPIRYNGAFFKYFGLL